MNSRFSSNSEANPSELLENHEYMFSRYYMHSDKLAFPNSQPHHSVIPVAKGSMMELSFTLFILITQYNVVQNSATYMNRHVVSENNFFKIYRKS